MLLIQRSIVTCFVAATVFAVFVGCGDSGSGGSPPAASIAGSQAGDPASPESTSEPASPADASDRIHPRVVVETSEGNFTLELDAQNAPLTVDNFLTYVSNGHYDNTIFHQVVPQQPKLVLGGGYTSELTAKPTSPPIRNEADNGLKNRRGTIAMARRPDAIDSATSHFFINLSDNPMLDHSDRTLDGYGYCVFGSVVEGLDVVERIGSAEIHDTDEFAQIPVDPVVVRSMRCVK